MDTENINKKTVLVLKPSFILWRTKKTETITMTCDTIKPNLYVLNTFPNDKFLTLPN